MAGSLNKVQVIGNVGADPEIRSFQSGDRVANLRVATSESWKDKQTGEKKEQTEWHSVAIFGGLVDIVERYVHKGSKVFLEGQLRTRKWQDQSGNDRYTTEIVLRPYAGDLILLGDPGGASGGQQRGGGSAGGGATGGQSGGGRGLQWDERQNGPGRQGGFGGAAGGGASGGAGGGFGDDLDDSIPF